MVFPNQPHAPPLHLDRSRGLPSDWVISLCEDREQNLWCGTGSGLAMIRRSNLEVLSPPDNWKGRALLSVLPASDGSIWAGTEGAGLYRLQGSEWTNFDAEAGIRNPYIWSLAADPAGRIWAGTWGGGLFAQKDGAFDFAPGLEKLREPMPALFFSGDELWIGTPQGALRWREGKLTRFREIDGEPFGDVRAIARDKAGALWFGTAGRGLVRLEGATFRRFTKADGLSSDFVECLRFTDDGTLWIASFGGGLNRLKAGKFSTINWRQGLPNGVIGHIETDNFGRLWMSSYGGIIAASERDLNLGADGVISEVPFVTYGIHDGMPTPECAEGSQSAGGKSADGRLWFPTAKGLVVVDPANVVENPLQPPVRIEEVLVDGKKAWAGHSSQPLRVGPGRHRIEFAYTGLSFVTPEKVRFKYRLVDFDPDWVNAGARRTAIYDNIPPGDYVFEVRACNNDGVWSETGASLACEIRPYFWQTIWFRALAGGAAVLLAGGAVWFETRRRMRRKLRLAERERDIERERSRIARDIHDDLGAQLTRITMISDSARGELARPERVASGLEKIYDTARELTRRIDEIVWAVNPRHDTLESLAAYLEKYAQDWLASVGCRCRLDLPVQFPDWHLTSEVRHNVFLALKEALNNAVKHSGSREVFIRLVIGQSSFEWTVEDNGRGFSPETEGAGSGNGLKNMRQRMAEIGGRSRIESVPGAGARVIFSIEIATPKGRSAGFDREGRQI
jgi:signal transduction histidine kinase